MQIVFFSCLFRSPAVSQNSPLSHNFRECPQAVTSQLNRPKGSFPPPLFLLFSFSNDDIGSPLWQDSLPSCWHQKVSPRPQGASSRAENERRLFLAPLSSPSAKNGPLPFVDFGNDLLEGSGLHFHRVVLQFSKFVRVFSFPFPLKFCSLARIRFRKFRRKPFSSIGYPLCSGCSFLQVSPAAPIVFQPARGPLQGVF